MGQPDRLEVPLAPLAVNLLGALMMAAGLVGLIVTEIREHVPALADPPTAWALIGVGLALDLWSIPAIIRAARKR